MTTRERLERKSDEDIDLLCRQFMPKAKKYSYVNGVFDEDLYSEQLLAILKALKKFSFNEEEFARIYAEFEKEK